MVPLTFDLLHPPSPQTPPLSNSHAQLSPSPDPTTLQFSCSVIPLPRPQNMIAQSQSGTGKTAAFVLATLSRIDEEHRFPQVSWGLQVLQLVRRAGPSPDSTNTVKTVLATLKRIHCLRLDLFPIFLLIILNDRFLGLKINPVQALILSPTYELAIQTGEVIEKMASRTNIQIEYAIRGKKCECYATIFLLAEND